MARKYGGKEKPTKTYLYENDKKSIREYLENDNKYFPEKRYVTNMDDENNNNEDVFYAVDQLSGKKYVIEKKRVIYIGIYNDSP